MTPIDWPPWAVMWALAVVIFGVCKWLTWWRTSTPRTPTWRHAAYLLAWPGLDARAFLNPNPLPRDRRPAPGEWAFAAGKLALGVALTWGAVPFVPADLPLCRGWCGMVGLVFLLHFGSFHLLSCAWRAGAVEYRLPRPDPPLPVPPVVGAVRPAGRCRGRVPVQRRRTRPRHLRPSRWRVRVADALLCPPRARAVSRAVVVRERVGARCGVERSGVYRGRGHRPGVWFVPPAVRARRCAAVPARHGRVLTREYGWTLPQPT
jgi:hypothetical protein